MSDVQNTITPSTALTDAVSNLSSEMNGLEHSFKASLDAIKKKNDEAALTGGSLRIACNRIRARHRTAIVNCE